VRGVGAQGPPVCSALLIKKVEQRLWMTSARPASMPHLALPSDMRQGDPRPFSNLAANFRIERLAPEAVRAESSFRPGLRGAHAQGREQVSLI
jgi:hypothetical protein